MFKKILELAAKPELYAPSTKSLWNDEHVSKGMLKAHLDPNIGAASRKHSFIDQSVEWVSKVAPPSTHRDLLDLGCGPGLYAERFANSGYSVTGIDFSTRSIAYAQEQTQVNQSGIEYILQDYLTIGFDARFDVVTLIYCDYAVLSVDDRLVLLQKIHRALKPGGKLIFDVFTPIRREEEARVWTYFSFGGFFSPRPHVLLEAVHQYDDVDETELHQNVVISELGVDCFNIWNHYFTREKLGAELAVAGFSSLDFYGDVAGASYSEESETICVVATREPSL